MTATEKMKKIIETKGLTEAQLAGISMHNRRKSAGKPGGNAETKPGKYCTDNGISFEE